MAEPLTYFVADELEPPLRWFRDPHEAANFCRDEYLRRHALCKTPGATMTTAKKVEAARA